MEVLAGRYEPAELNRIGFPGCMNASGRRSAWQSGWGAKAALEVDKILTAT